MFTKKCQCIVDPCCTMHLLRNEAFVCIHVCKRGREREGEGGREGDQINRGREGMIQRKEISK